MPQIVGRLIRFGRCCTVQDGGKRRVDHDAGWLLATLGLACCITSKEAIRYTALWQFELKSPMLLMLMMAIMLLAFTFLMFFSHRCSKRFYESRPVVFGIAALQCAGMAVHSFRLSGAFVPEWMVPVSFVAIDAALLLLAVYLQYLLRFTWEYRVSVFLWGIVVAGFMQFMLLFLAVDVARAIVSCSALISGALLVCADGKSREAAREGRDEREGGAEGQGEWQGFSLISAFCNPKGFSCYCLIVFLVSVVIMGSYSQWRGQQDGELVSLLLQACSAIGFMFPALSFTMLGKSLRAASLFHLGIIVVLPVSMGALYLATIFSGPSISLAVFLFDAAYATVLLVIWMAPRALGSVDSFEAVCAGLLAYKLGWFVGVMTTASLPQDRFSWLGNVATTIALLCLMVIIVLFLAKNLRFSDGEKTDSADLRNVAAAFDAVCDSFGRKYRLTGREREVLRLLAKGRTASYIARDLVVSEPTVRTHISHIYRKTAVNSQQQLIDLVEDHGRLQGQQ